MDWRALLAAAVVVGAYLLGGIPWALLIGRWTRGIDIREHGSGNTGAANSFRILGKGPGFAVFALDFAKGVVPMLVATWVATLLPAAWTDILLVLTGAAAMLGHTYSPYMRFAGGKAIATGGGVVLVLSPLCLLVIGVVFFAVAVPTRYISLGAVVAALAYPLTVAFLYQGRLWLLAFAAFAALLVVWRHRGNIGRIIRGRESRATWGIFPPDERAGLDQGAPPRSRRQAPRGREGERE
jgi:glycerol-3-phosphate acyltransferase PlsY